MKKKIISIVCALALIGTMTAALTACDVKGGGGNAAKVKVNANDVYALSALTGAEYLAQTESGATGAAETTRPGVITDADVSGIKDCLNMFDDVISGGGITQTVEKNEDVEGLYKDYPFVMTVTVGNTGITAKMYYKEVNTVTETEIDDGEEETEVSTTLSGVMVFGDQKFDVTGKKEIETEGDEKEISIEFTTKSRENPLNYVKIKQSVEVENGAQEVEYEYEIYENDEKVREFKLEVEDENGKTEVSFKMEIENVPEETEYKIIKGDVDGKFKIKYEKGKEKGFITVEAVEGGYKLTYNNGYSEVI
ncbi:MAG: hypothetical protein L6V82_02820 [Clostridiales bacterium]|nr:MAG: hypothetical protein L6V82_02820 [Clostridiales bacterium]